MISDVNDRTDGIFGGKVVLRLINVISLAKEKLGCYTESRKSRV
jgi:hypothetical protein